MPSTLSIYDQRTAHYRRRDRLILLAAKAYRVGRYDLWAYLIRRVIRFGAAL